MKNLRTVLEASMNGNSNKMINEGVSRYKKKMYDKLMKVKIQKSDIETLAKEICDELIEIDNDNGNQLKKRRFNFNYDVNKIMKVLDHMKEHFETCWYSYAELAMEGEYDDDEDEYAPQNCYVNSTQECSGVEIIDKYLASLIFETLYSRQFGDMNDDFLCREGDRPHYYQAEELEDSDYDDPMNEFLMTLF